jgi:hypothetical protein
MKVMCSLFSEIGIYEPYFQSILLWLFWRWEVGSHELLAQAGLELNPPNLSFPSSRDYRSKPPMPDYIDF